MEFIVSVRREDIDSRINGRMLWFWSRWWRIPVLAHPERLDGPIPS
jgi:hypothetical protein